jgi:hypothetical protein
MINSPIILLLLSATLSLVACDVVKVSESFTGNGFNNADGIF